MQTTVKHARGQLVFYVGAGERAFELRFFPFKWLTHAKRVELGRKPKPRQPPSDPDAPLTLPGFVEPEHPPQTSTALGPQ